MRQTIKYARVRASDAWRAGLKPTETRLNQAEYSGGVTLTWTRGVYLRGTKVRIHG